MFERYADAFAGGILLLIAAAMYAVIPAPGETVVAEVDLSLAPRLVALLLGGLSLLLFLKGIHKAFVLRPAGSGKALFKYPGRLAATIALTALAAVAFEPLGFKITAAIYLFVEGYILSYGKGEFRPGRMAAISLVAPVVIYYAFGTWLSMPLPEGLF